jgi:hypothetical protein
MRYTGINRATDPGKLLTDDRVSLCRRPARRSGAPGQAAQITHHDADDPAARLRAYFETARSRAPELSAPAPTRADKTSAIRLVNSATLNGFPSKGMSEAPPA